PPDRRGNRRRYARQPVPLRHLRTDPRGRTRRVRDAGRQIMTTPVTRRDFIKVSALAGGGLMIGFRFEEGNAQGTPPATTFKPNAWVTIASDGSITLTCHRNEMGQDVHTSLAMLI